MKKTGRLRSATGIDGNGSPAAPPVTSRSRRSLVARLKGAIAHDAIADPADPPDWYRENGDEVEPDAATITRAVQRLTDRIRAMDDGARRVLTDLDSQLDEVIRRLKAISSGGGKPAELATALQGVAAVVDRLTRDVDNADEKARSSVEGLHVRAGNLRKDRDPETDGVVNAIRDLHARIASMSKRISAPTVEEPAENWGTIRSRIDCLLAEGSEPIDGGNVDDAPLSLDGHGKDAGIRPAVPASATGSAPIGHGDRDRDRPVEHRTAPPVGRGATDRGASTGAPFDNATSSREGRQAPSRRAISAHEPVKPSVESLAANDHDAIMRLEARVAGMARAVDAAINATQRQAPANGAAIDRLAARLLSIDERIDRLAGHTSSADTMLEVCRRLDAVCRRLIDFPTVLDPLRSELADLRRDLAERDTHVFARLDELIGGLVARVDDLPAGPAGSAGGLARAAGIAADEQGETAGAGRRAARAFVREMVGAGDDHGVTPPASDGSAAPANAAETPAVKPSPPWSVAAGLAHGQSSIPSADRRPSESRMNRLNMAALRELARSSTHGQPGPAEDRKAGFIAAARQAAQASAATARNAEPDRIESPPSAVARVGQAIRDHKRALLLLVPILLVVSAASMIGEGFDPAGGPVADAGASGDRTASTAKAKPLQVASQATTDAVEPAPATAKAKAEPPIAFALPEPRGSRFAAAPDAPPTIAFVGADMADMPPLDDTIGRSALRAAAATGDANAAFEIAARYAEGRVVRRDLAKAAYWYERAADDGIAVAQYRLASLYERGQGVEADRVKAAAWYRKAADLGSVGAMHNLAVMLSEGVAGAANHSEAVKYFRAAADRGVADSQYNLGVVYGRGLGVARDFAESYKWFALAAASGDAEAEANRDQIGKLLSSVERAKARRAVAAWRPHPLVAEANPGSAVGDLWDAATADISETDRRALVRKIQKLLAARGYDPGPADGVSGAQTQAAVRAYQRDTGLAETGKINRDLVAALAKPSR